MHSGKTLTHKVIKYQKAAILGTNGLESTDPFWGFLLMTYIRPHLSTVLLPSITVLAHEPLGELWKPFPHCGRWGGEGGYDCMRCEITKEHELKLNPWALAQKIATRVYEAWRWTLSPSRGWVTPGCHSYSTHKGSFLKRYGLPRINPHQP